MNYEPKILRVTVLAAVITAAAGLCAAGQGRVSVPSSCYEGQAFTIVVPVQLPAGGPVCYRWYRNGRAIAGASDCIIGSGHSVTRYIRYTIPADSAHGANVEFYFRYYMDGDAQEHLSPVYVMSFCSAVAAGDIGGEGCGAVSSGDISGSIGCGEVSEGSIGGAGCGEIAAGGIGGTGCGAVVAGDISGPGCGSPGVVGTACNITSVGEIGNPCRSTVGGTIGNACNSTTVAGVIGSNCSGAGVIGNVCSSTLGGTIGNACGSTTVAGVIGLE